MSEHTLPPDPSSWPRDPFRLLGVSPGVSARDLRKAYLRLIRAYKPEHSPEEFKRIRDAYESALPFVERSARPRFEDEGKLSSPPETPPTSTPLPPSNRPQPGPDPWRLACDGEPESAYRMLVERQVRGLAREHDFLQLYWLLALLPALDPARAAVDWLIRGLQSLGSDSPRLRELLKRELAADPSLTLGDRLATFFRRRTAPSLTLDVAEARWRSARDREQWALILADVQTLRAWMPEVDESSWPRVLMAAAMNLAWAPVPHFEPSKVFVREIESFGNRLDDRADELYQIEFLQLVRSGLERLGGRRGPYSKLYPLLTLSWDERGPEFRARLRAYVTQVAQGPSMMLERLDEIQAQAPAVLGRLSTLLGGLDFEAYRFLGHAHHNEIAPEIGRFLDSRDWTDYRALRPSLLKFCLGQAVSPGLMARTMAERPEFIMTGKSPLAHAIQDDGPLRHVYRACEIARESPEDR